ncbi:MAG: type II toxin-antitoxin system MqsA family antitoxin [Candidatus Desulfaltia sp.]|nr:type II toxin-antitoxin system MqsA family antitoxin [Candidatus Desulfaltia sp.]
MLCTNCFQDECRTTTISKDVVINGRTQTIGDVECEKCPSCGDIVFTHLQSLALDKKRVNLEFSSKPLLTPAQLKLLRKILNMNLEEICQILHIGKNSYGRWERGELETSPSMNLLVHQLIERFPEARVNLIESEMQAEIEKAKDRYLTDSVSLGEFVRNVLRATKIIIDVACDKLGIAAGALERIENNDLPPERIPASVSANILKYFQLTVDNLRQLFDNTLKIQVMRQRISFMHTRTTVYGKASESTTARSLNKVLERYVSEEESIEQPSVDPEYLRKIGTFLQDGTEGRS